MKPGRSDKEWGQDPHASKWVELIGPEYAAIIRPFRKLIIVGGVGIFVGLAAGLFWQSRAGLIPRPTEFLGGMAFFLPGFATFMTGLVLQTRLAQRINSDLWVVGVLPAKYAPDLRNPSRFLFWCRHFGVSPEQVQEAGKRAAELRSAPNDQESWDFSSKKRGGGDRTENE